nr:ATP-binding protein [Tissierella sp.]
MKKYKKMVFISALIALASQISIGIINNNFRISAGIITYVLLVLYYEDIKPIPIGILSGVMVFFLRTMVHFLINGNINNVIISYLPEVLFYTFYSLIYFLLTKMIKTKNINIIFIILIISDFLANFIEVFIRSDIDKSPFLIRVSLTLFIVSIVRSIIIWIILNIFKYYKMLLLKEEHEDRYKKLLYLTSELKTEMYWIEKNMDNIENVMSQSYELFEKINKNEDHDTWQEKALNIARDVHEIKKENGLVIRGIKEITESELNDKGMDFKDIINILVETMKREIRLMGKDIVLEYSIEENFYTSKHYYIMSMLRNLIMNSIEAADHLKDDSKIIIKHEADKENHYFLVSDNGIGIDKEGLKHILSPGFSTKINYDTGEINRGLGLSIVQYILEEQLDGSISISSIIGEGSKFKITIPRKTVEEN